MAIKPQVMFFPKANESVRVNFGSDVYAKAVVHIFINGSEVVDFLLDGSSEHSIEVGLGDVLMSEISEYGHVKAGDKIVVKVVPGAGPKGEGFDDTVFAK